MKHDLGATLFEHLLEDGEIANVAARRVNEFVELDEIEEARRGGRVERKACDVGAEGV